MKIFHAKENVGAWVLFLGISRAGIKEPNVQERNWMGTPTVDLILKDFVALRTVDHHHLDPFKVQVL
jgi:hypothetical protein